MIKDGPPPEMSLPNMNVDGGRGAMWQNHIDELHELLKEKQNLENEIRGDIRSLQSKLSGESSRLPQGNEDMTHEFNERVNELNIAYDDIITSTKEHL